MAAAPSTTSISELPIYPGISAATNNIVLEDVLQGNSNFWLVSDDDIPPGSAEHQILGIKYETRNY